MTESGTPEERAADPASAAADNKAQAASATTRDAATAEATNALPAAAGAKLDKKKTIIGGIVTLVVLGLVFWGLSKRFGSFSEAWATIKEMSPLSIAALALVAIVNIVVYVFPYMVAIPGLKYKPAFMVRQTSWAIGALIPAGGAVAVAVQYVMLAFYKVKPAAATTGIAVTSVWSMFMTFLLPVLGVLALIPSGQIQASWIWLGVLGLAALAAMIIVFWLILRSEKSALKVGAFGQKIANPVLKKLHKQVDVTTSIMHFREGIVDVVKAHWISLTVTNLSVSLMQFMILFVSVRAVSHGAVNGVTALEIFGAFAISRMGSLLPLTPGGLGTVFGLLAVMLGAFGLPDADVVAATVVWQVVSLLPQAITGMATFLGWRISEARSQRVVFPE